MKKAILLSFLYAILFISPFPGALLYSEESDDEATIQWGDWEEEEGYWESEERFQKTRMKRWETKRNKFRYNVARGFDKRFDGAEEETTKSLPRLFFFDVFGGGGSIASIGLNWYLFTRVMSLNVYAGTGFGSRPFRNLVLTGLLNFYILPNKIFSPYVGGVFASTLAFFSNIDMYVGVSFGGVAGLQISPKRKRSIYLDVRVLYDIEAGVVIRPAAGLKF